MPIDDFCISYLQAEQLPVVSNYLSFEGHIRDLPNYYTAGCFVKYLVSTYGTTHFAILYPTGDYFSVYGKSIHHLEAEWRNQLATQEPSMVLDSNAFSPNYR